MHDIDKQVLKQAANGSLEAFEYIYRQTSGFVYNVALRVINNRLDAEEVTQDVFMKIYRNLPQFRFRAQFKTWVYRITVNTALNMRRSRPKETADYDWVVNTASTNPSSAIESHGFKQRVQKLLETLPIEQRVCIVLRDLEGLSYKEISKALNIKLNTVRSRLRRARESLMKNSRLGGSNYAL